MEYIGLDRSTGLIVWIPNIQGGKDVDLIHLVQDGIHFRALVNMVFIV